MWKRLARQHDEALLISITTFVYGLSTFFLNTSINLLDPPAKYFLTGLLIVLPILKVVAIFMQWRNLKGWLLVMIAMTWAFIAWLYFFNTVINAGWILSLSMVGFSFLSLDKGEFRE